MFSVCPLLPACLAFDSCTNDFPLGVAIKIVPFQNCKEFPTWPLQHSECYCRCGGSFETGQGQCAAHGISCRAVRLESYDGENGWVICEVHHADPNYPLVDIPETTERTEPWSTSFDFADPTSLTLSATTTCTLL